MSSEAQQVIAITHVAEAVIEDSGQTCLVRMLLGNDTELLLTLPTDVLEGALPRLNDLVAKARTTTGRNAPSPYALFQEGDATPGNIGRTLASSARPPGALLFRCLRRLFKL